MTRVIAACFTMHERACEEPRLEGACCDVKRVMVVTQFEEGSSRRELVRNACAAAHSRAIERYAELFGSL